MGRFVASLGHTMNGRSVQPSYAATRMSSFSSTFRDGNKKPMRKEKKREEKPKRMGGKGDEIMNERNFQIKSTFFFFLFFFIFFFLSFFFFFFFFFSFFLSVMGGMQIHRQCEDQVHHGGRRERRATSDKDEGIQEPRRH